MLTIRKLADTSKGTREVRYDNLTGERYLYNPETEKPEPWPLAGVQLGDETPPKKLRVSMDFLSKGILEGWIEIEGKRVEHRPGGPPGDEWRVTHTFVHCDAVVMHFTHGDVRYKVVHQPDKYVADGPDRAKVTDEIYDAGETRIDWFYDLTLEA